MMNLSLLSEKNPLLALKMQSTHATSTSKYAWKYCLDGVDVLFAYGVGDGSLYTQIALWLRENKERKFIWIAEDEGDAWSFCGLEDPQVTHCTLGEIEVLKQAVWKSVLLKAGWAVPSHLEAPKQLIETLRSGIALLLFKARDFGKQELSNVLDNLGDKCVVPFGQMKKMPAIICGSGASLDPKALKYFESRAYLFAGGSALGKLTADGIQPHFGGGVDSNPGELETGKDIPFFYTDRFCAKTLKNVSGSKLWIRATDELPIEEWMSDQLNLECPKIDLGWSVGCAITAIAAKMGCDPIIFHGMDLADEKDQIEVVDKWGKKTKSRQDLIMSASFLSELILQYPDRTWIDATPQGLTIQGAKKQSLKSIQLPEIVLKPIQFEKRIADATHVKTRVEKSIQECQKLCLENSKASLYELECELFYQYHLKPLWQLWRPVLFREGDEKLQAMLFYKRVLKAYE